MEVDLMCECNLWECTAPLPVNEEGFRHIQREHPGAAIVLPGHEDRGDQVLERGDGYLVVKEAGLGG